MPNKKVRIFAGPNGSGKSSLYHELSKLYSTGYFINADEIENRLVTKGLIDLKDFGVAATQIDLTDFSKLPASLSLLEKAAYDNHAVNISVSENCIIDPSKDSHSYEAAYVASFIRHLVIRQNKSFSFETVMSHAGKVPELKNLISSGYKLYFYFVCTDDPEVNVARVANRVEKGGHPVSKIKIIERYSRTLELLYKVLPLCYRAYLFDNSGKKQVMIAEIYSGAMEIKTDSIPHWFINYVLPYYKK